MSGLGAWISSIAGPIVIRVLTSLGVGTVTYAGADAALTAALNAAKNSFAGLGTDVFQLLAIAGIFESMSITAGALSAGAALLLTRHFALRTTG